MPYVLVEDFRGGLDSRRTNVTSVPGSLVQLTNAHITRGGEIEKRRAFVKLADLPSDTLGLAAAGGQIYTFTLRQGVEFHDGQAWNCAAAKLNFDHVLAQNHPWYGMPAAIKSWSCTNSNTFVLTTNSKYYPLLQELTFIRPLRMQSPAVFFNGASSNSLTCLLYTSPSPRDMRRSRMPSSA